MRRAGGARSHRRQKSPPCSLAATTPSPTISECFVLAAEVAITRCRVAGRQPGAVAEQLLAQGTGAVFGLVGAEQPM